MPTIIRKRIFYGSKNQTAMQKYLHWLSTHKEYRIIDADNGETIIKVTYEYDVERGKNSE